MNFINKLYETRHRRTVHIHSGVVRHLCVDHQILLLHVAIFNFRYFTLDNTIQLYDLKNKKIFLGRIPCTQVTLQDVYVGAIFTVFSRKLKVIDYADEFTRSRFLAKQK